MRFLLVALLAASAGAASHLAGIFIELPSALMGPVFALGYFISNRFIRAGLGPRHDVLPLTQQLGWMLLVALVYIPAAIAGIVAGTRVPVSWLLPFVGGR